VISVKSQMHGVVIQPEGLKDISIGRSPMQSRV